MEKVHEIEFKKEAFLYVWLSIVQDVFAFAICQGSRVNAVSLKYIRHDPVLKLFNLARGLGDNPFFTWLSLLDLVHLISIGCRPGEIIKLTHGDQEVPRHHLE